MATQRQIFIASGTFTKPANIVDFRVLAVAGGGGGGASANPGGNDASAGGGGAGGMIEQNLVITSNQAITVGAGGAGAISANNGQDGGGSSIGSLVVVSGGGGGGGAQQGSASNGNNGGSGGGGGSGAFVGATSGGTGIVGQGNNGGGGKAGPNPAGGGGGGKGGAGQSGAAGGAGGVGQSSSLSGSPVTYAIGGNGGGAYSGSANTGDGAGGASQGGGGVGGSGIVIIVWDDTIFTTDAMVKIIVDKTITTDAIIKDTTDKTFTSDGIIIADRVLLRTDGVVKDTTDKTFTTDGVIIAVLDQPTNLVVSGYKWLTNKLLTAQQKFNVRPFFTCKIVDDTIVPDQKMLLGAAISFGSSVRAPDGKILAVGFDQNNHVSFWKVSDASIDSQWAIGSAIVLDTSANLFPTNNLLQNNFTINVSDFINGTYHIDVYYFSNFVNSASLLTITHYHSDDGGTNWSNSITVNSPSIQSDSTQNVYISAGKPFQNPDGTITSMVFYLKKKQTAQFGPSIFAYDIVYQRYPGTGSTFNAETTWSRKIDSVEWTLHSLDTYFRNGVYYIVFSGVHNFLENVPSGNFSLYLTQLQKYIDNSSLDVWTFPEEIQSSLSSSSQNLNSFTKPKVADDGSSIFLTAKGTLVNAFNPIGVVTETIGLIFQSKDLLNFTYPTYLVFTDGTFFIMDSLATNFVKQGNFYFLGIGANRWRYKINNIIADVTNDVLRHSIGETAGSPFSLTLQIGNQNGKWFGASPTESGASAIAKNKKIFVEQGYYNEDGNPEIAPKNVFFIDDIKQNVTASDNSLLINARDLSKKLKTTISKFAYNFDGPIFYADNFDGTTISNWNQRLGSWIQDNNSMVTLDASGVPGSPGATDAVAVLTIPTTALPEYIMSMLVQFPDPNDAQASEYAAIYPFWQDSDNWFRIKIFPYGDGVHFSWQTERKNSGVVVNVNNQSSVAATFGSASWSASKMYPVLIRKYDWYKFNIIIGDNAGTGDSKDSFNTSGVPVVIAGSSGGTTDIDLTNQFTSQFVPNFGGWLEGTGSIAIGSKDVIGRFKKFKIAQFDNSQNLKELIEKIGTKASVFDFKHQHNFVDLLNNASVYNGTFTIPNRVLTVTAGNNALKNNQQVSNGEIEFDAKLTPTDPSSNYGIDIFFKNQSTVNTDNSYIWNIDKRSGVSGVVFISSRFKTKITGTSYLMTSSALDWLSPIKFFNLNFDLTKYHKYKLVFFDSWMCGFIDGVMVAAWQDTTTQSYLSGSIGFGANANTKIEIKNIISHTLFNQIEKFVVNPGDDLSGSLLHASQIVRAWTFSDLMGRLKERILNSTDVSTYTYQNQIYQQVTDNSDKEFANQVTVYGNGVSATSRSSESISENAKIRDEIVVDYKILTKQQAQERADFELVNFNKFNNQSLPRQILNVGAEVFDPVTIINTGANSTNVNSVLRVYSQKSEVGGGDHNSSYDLEIETGNL